jgi:hypothetical protein
MPLKIGHLQLGVKRVRLLLPMQIVLKLSTCLVLDFGMIKEVQNRLQYPIQTLTLILSQELVSILTMVLLTLMAQDAMFTMATKAGAETMMTMTSTQRKCVVLVVVVNQTQIQTQNPNQILILNRTQIPSMILIQLKSSMNTTQTLMASLLRKNSMQYSGSIATHVEEAKKKCSQSLIMIVMEFSLRQNSQIFTAK